MKNQTATLLLLGGLALPAWSQGNDRPQPAERHGIELESLERVKAHRAQELARKSDDTQIQLKELERAHRELTELGARERAHDHAEAKHDHSDAKKAHPKDKKAHPKAKKARSKDKHDRAQHDHDDKAHGKAAPEHARQHDQAEHKHDHAGPSSDLSRHRQELERAMPLIRRKVAERREHLPTPRRSDNGPSQRRNHPAPQVHAELLERIERRFMELDKRLRALERRNQPRPQVRRPSDRV